MRRFHPTALSLCAALLTAGAPCLATAASPWDGTWSLEVLGKERSRPQAVRLQGLPGGAGAERIVGQSTDRGDSWQLELSIVPGEGVGMVAMTATRKGGVALICAGVVDRGAFAGTCYDRRGRDRPFTLRPLQLDASRPDAAAASPAAAPPPAVAPVAVPAPVPPSAPAVPPPAAEPPPPSCQDILLRRGHHPTHLRNCQGAEPSCAVAVLEAGHHPSHLSHCKASLEPGCVKALLQKGHHPTHLGNCAGVEPSCAGELLARGHHPTHLRSCQGVDPPCALGVLRAGHHPTHLGNCRR